MALYGRSRESRILAEVVETVRTGRSAVLVVRGESGSGKTALLDQLDEQSPDCAVSRIAGIQSEAHFAFGGIERLCAPSLDYLEELPPPQRTALRVALGLEKNRPAERFLVSLATLNLMTLSSEHRPLLCLVDDVQWVDRESVEALAFVARRLLAEPIGLVVAVRGLYARTEFAGLPEMVLKRLDHHASRQLLNSVLPGRLDQQVQDRMIAEANGNPLALLELARVASFATSAGGFDLPDTTPVQGKIEASYQRRLRRLPRDLQLFLLLAAADPIGDVPLIWRATRALGIRIDQTMLPAVSEFAEVDVRIRFTHPLVRSAIYRMASPADVRAAHSALADATDSPMDADRCAWHRAQAAAGIDDRVADDLVDGAHRAQSRGGVAAAGAFLTRAAELTGDPHQRAVRALAAAGLKIAAGAFDSADELLAVAGAGPLDEVEGALLLRLRAQVAFSLRRGADAPALLIGAARRLAPFDVALCRATYLEALGAAMFVGRLDEGNALIAAANAASAAPPAPYPPRAMDLLLDAVIARATQGFAASVAPTQRALRAFREARGLGDQDVRWLWLACRLAPEVWDDESFHQIASRQVHLARDTGALSALPIADAYWANVHVQAGEFLAAEALVEESDTISQAIGSPPLVVASLELAAWRGQEDAFRSLASSGVADALDRGEGRVDAVTEFLAAVLYNGLGRHGEALAAAKRASEYDDWGLFGWSLCELVESAARSDELDAAATALSELRGRTQASGTPWALGMEARSAALVANGGEAEAKFREALAQLAQSRIKVHVARTHLLFGEWLNQENRQAEAVGELRRAQSMFREMGADAFEERASRELRSAGAEISPHAQTLMSLTAQEARIAKMARSGRTRSEIGAQLFMSPRTVEWHLAQVFAKLEVQSVQQLREVIA